jgi:hypothetical protein
MDVVTYFKVKGYAEAEEIKTAGICMKKGVK